LTEPAPDGHHLHNVADGPGLAPCHWRNSGPITLAGDIGRGDDHGVDHGLLGVSAFAVADQRHQVERVDVAAKRLDGGPRREGR
jgi:hypothetical protein